jgi:tetratricopeptide (TPR) repeat protein
VSKKYKRTSTLPTGEALEARVRRAMQEGRFQQALELSKQLNKQDPTPAHHELVRQTHLGRAQQLRTQGHLRDAQVVLNNALALGDDPNFLVQIAEELAACGAARQALALLNRHPEGTARSRILARAADVAVERGPSGRNELPEALRGPFDAVLRAFVQVEAGEDDAARDTLQGIGLQSPFLEWKLLLRGLMAYYQKDDTRAVENWQRLSAERLPARLAAPLRSEIDAAFRNAQTQGVQALLRKQADRLQTSDTVQQLRALQFMMHDSGQLAQGFRAAERLLPTFRQHLPNAIPRLAACFYWAVITNGEVEDVVRYERVFGGPADDPRLARLRALQAEHIGELEEAHRRWQQFEQNIQGNPAWGAHSNRARALVWTHMGKNAAAVPDLDKMPNLPPFLREHPDRPPKLKPSAEDCFTKSLDLAPDQLNAHESLFQYLLRREEDRKAERAARRLLEQFPQHAPTLEALGDLLQRKHRDAEAVTAFQRAVQASPLERRLRKKLSTAHLFKARSEAEAGHFDAARAEYQSALAGDASNVASVLCKWAACEFKAGDTARAEELLAQAQAQAGSRLAVAYSMLIETIRLKLPAPLKTRFNREFNEALGEPPTGRAAVAVAETAAVHHQADITYHGQKTHEKKVFGYLDNALKADLSEEELRRATAALAELESIKLLQRYADQGRDRFPQNPYFPFLQAEGFLAQGPNRAPVWKLQPLLAEAHRLAEALPEGEERQTLLDEIEERQQLTGMSGGLFGMMEGLFGGFMDEFDYDDEDEDDGW